MEVTKDPNSNPGRLDDSDPELELYTIPSSSRWFAWDEIHETERTAFKEFFDASSISRTPKIYKEYRDFIINKYREEPSRRLTFTEVRKSLVGDVTFLHKAFHFLENWGLINYGAPPAADAEKEEEEEEPCKVRLEEGTPNGIRVAATPNSLKPMLLPRGAKTSANATGASLKLPPLASYSDIYRDLIRQKEGNCGLCGGKCGSGHYRCTQDNFIICANCFKSGNYGEKRSAEDFVLSESSENSGKHDTVWTEGEILLLLESVLKHGDDWELVAQSVQTKTKLDCISKLIELPFGELMLGPAHRNVNVSGANGIVVNNAKQVQSSSSDYQEISKTKDQPPELTKEIEQNGDAVKESPSKRQRVTPLSDSSGSLMNQVGLISNVVDPHITAAAADAAVSALCDENLCPREIFDVEEDSARDLEGEGLEMERSSISGYWSFLEVHPSYAPSRGSKQMQTTLALAEIPLPLRVRAATATALGAAAARAKLLADQEVREIEHLVATIIKAQIDKLLHKVKHFDDLELLMEKEHAEMENLKDSILTERIDVLRRTFRSGITRWKDYSYVKS
ncbi:SWI/SNF complex subunit [Vigna angularis]|uniref:SWI/SNF complex subunit n=1 Tax=Phaseolus angularis TaxID=3914 RepID=A0A8T0KID8_PHAAN|nr:SWI/SNF complex subunit [Vigna angularis]